MAGTFGQPLTACTQCVTSLVLYNFHSKLSGFTRLHGLVQKHYCQRKHLRFSFLFIPCIRQTDHIDVFLISIIVFDCNYVEGYGMCEYAMT